MATATKAQTQEDAAITYKPAQMKSFLRTIIKMPSQNGDKPAAMMWGPPGVGKTALVESICAELGIPCITIIAAQYDPVDVRGIPVAIDGVTRWCTPDIWPRDGQGVIFLDELPNAPQSTQNSFQQAIHARAIGDYKVPDGWTFIAAGNRLADRAGAGKLTSAISSRFIHSALEPDLKDWCSWAVTAEANIHPLTIGFLRFRPEFFHQFDKDAQSFPCPRTWEFISKITHMSPDKDMALGMYAGAVGHGPAIEYASYERLYRKLPPIETILMNPSTAPVPQDVGVKYAISAALSRHANDKNIGRVFEYLDRKELGVEYNVMAVRDLIARDASLGNCPEFINWATKHQNVVL